MGIACRTLGGGLFVLYVLFFFLNLLIYLLSTYPSTVSIYTYERATAAEEQYT
jgi:hypothetical protein